MTLTILICSRQVIQSRIDLWTDLPYNKKIYRLNLESKDFPSALVKYISLSSALFPEGPFLLLIGYESQESYYSQEFDIVQE